MKVKTVIVLKTRHNAVQYHSKSKLAKDMNMFNYGNSTYSTDSNDFIITSRWLGVIKRSYITFYFREGHTKALPFPLFEDMEDSGVPGPELNAIFTPKFYQIIARKPGNKKQDMIYYFTLVSALTGLACAYMLYKMPDTISKILGGG